MASRIRKENKWILLTYLCVSSIQMSQFALNSGIATINAFFDKLPLSTIQTAVSLPNLLSMVAALVSAFFIERSAITKKASIVGGLFLAAAASVFAALLHTEFWHLCLYNIMLGIAMGMYISTMTSVMFDHFSTEETRVATGYQTACVNGGCIILSIICGLLTTITWYAGYFILIVALPVGILALRALPNTKMPKPTKNSEHKRTKLPRDTIYFGIVMFCFNIAYTVAGSNISSHLAAFGNSSIAGYATAIQMLGGVFVGTIFRRISKKFGDYLFPIACFALGLGYTLLNIFSYSLPVCLFGLFLVGMTLSLVSPQMMFSVSKLVDSTNSAMATSIITCIAPGLSGFFSPIVFTNLTHAIAGENTSFRYQFTGVFCFVLTVVFFITTYLRSKNEVKTLEA